MKTVFITGASRGIGKALAEKFLREGYEVIGTSTSGKSNYSNNNLTFLKLDISSEKSIEKCVKDFKKLPREEGTPSGANKKIDILINNAGIVVDIEDKKVNLKKLKKTLDVNLIGTISFCESILPFINSGGQVINITSKSGSIGTIPYSDHPSYNISKAGLNMYTKVLSYYLSNRNILVNAFNPGSVKTDMNPEGKISVEESANDMFKRIVTLKETGKFWFKDKEFPW